MDHSYGKPEIIASIKETNSCLRHGICEPLRSLKNNSAVPSKFCVQKSTVKNTVENYKSHAVSKWVCVCLIKLFVTSLIESASN